MIRFKTNDALGFDAYEVYSDGVLIGSVRKRRVHYNLHPRPATYTVWTAYLLHGEKVGGDFTRRRDAGAQIVEANRS